MANDSAHSIQHFEITIPANAATATYTLPTAVVPAKSFILRAGDTPSASGNPSACRAGATLESDGLTVTARRHATASAITVKVRGTVVHAKDALVDKVEWISIAHGNNVDTTKVATLAGTFAEARTAVVHNGAISDSTGQNQGNGSWNRAALTGASQVTSTRSSNSNALTSYHCVVEFAAGALDGSVQSILADPTASATITHPVALSPSVALARTVCLFGGRTWTTFNNYNRTFQDYLLAATDRVDFTTALGGTGSDYTRQTRVSVVPFAPGVVATIARGTLTIASGQTSASAGVGPVAVADALPILTGFAPSDGADLPSILPRLRLASDGASIIAERDGTTGTVRVGYELVTFAQSGGVTGPTLSRTGPASTPVGTAVPLEVAIGGTDAPTPDPLTFTPSSTPSGVAFSPATVQLTQGQRTAAFTATSAAPGTFSISGTTDGAYPAPAAVSHEWTAGSLSAGSIALTRDWGQVTLARTADASGGDGGPYAYHYRAGDTQSDASLGAWLPMSANPTAIARPKGRGTVVEMRATDGLGATAVLRDFTAAFPAVLPVGVDWIGSSTPSALSTSVMQTAAHAFRGLSMGLVGTCTFTKSAVPGTRTTSWQSGSANLETCLAKFRPGGTHASAKLKVVAMMFTGNDFNSSLGTPLTVDQSLANSLAIAEAILADATAGVDYVVVAAGGYSAAADGPQADGRRSYADRIPEICDFARIFPDDAGTLDWSMTGPDKLNVAQDHLGDDAIATLGRVVGTTVLSPLPRYLSGPRLYLSGGGGEPGPARLLIVRVPS